MLYVSIVYKNIKYVGICVLYFRDCCTKIFMDKRTAEVAISIQFLKNDFR
jgi:hypothetical protein